MEQWWYNTNRWQRTYSEKILSESVPRTGFSKSTSFSYVSSTAPFLQIHINSPSIDKREELGLRNKKINWLMGRRSTLSIHNKLMLYKPILKPAWTSGIQLWGCTKQSDTEIIQRVQNKAVTNIVHAPWYIRNADLLTDLQTELVKNETGKFARKHEDRLSHHVNVEAKQLLDNSELVRRLKNFLSWSSDH